MTPSHGATGRRYGINRRQLIGTVAIAGTAAGIGARTASAQGAGKHPEEQVKRDVLLAAQPTKEFVTVDQVAALAVFLCGDAAAQITGTNLSIDGGWTAA